MYIPKSFREDDLNTLHDLMRRYNFATLFSQVEGVPVASHLPFMIEPERGEFGTLITHMARANDHWQTVAQAQTALAVFQGAHSYISPNWYPEKNRVPTWNYAVVHAYGRPAVIHDAGRLREIVSELVEFQERHLDPAWNVEAAEAGMEAQLKAIVGVEIVIEKLEGKYKFNQNHPVGNQRGVVAALENSADPLQRETAQIMRANLDKLSDT